MEQPGEPALRRKAETEVLGVSYTWVVKYIPDDYKERPEIGPKKRVEESVARRATQEEEEEATAVIQPVTEEGTPICTRTAQREYFYAHFLCKLLGKQNTESYSRPLS